MSRRRIAASGCGLLLVRFSQIQALTVHYIWIDKTVRSPNQDRWVTSASEDPVNSEIELRSVPHSDITQMKLAFRSTGPADRASKWTP